MPAEPTSDPFELVIDVGADDASDGDEGARRCRPESAGTQERGSEPGSRVPRTHRRGKRERAVRLLRVELRRFWSRRLMRLLVVGVAVGIVIYGVVLFVTHSPERPSTEAVNRHEIDEAVQECRRSSDRDYKFELESLREQSEEEAARFLAQFPDVDAYADRICEPSHFGFYVPDPRFCLVDLWEKHLSYRDMCPDGALNGPRGSS